MPYTIDFAPSARRDLKKLERPVQRRVIEKAQSLQNNPRAPGTEKLEGGGDFYRVRTGDYRIVYTISDRKLIVLVVKIGNRKDVYR
jgi:mRNA interferase RelE/StbE